jgi:hypothetical protein
MKHLLTTICLLVLSAPGHAQREDLVRAHEAREYAGQYAMVCGVIASAKYLQNSRGAPTYLNFDKPYPDSEFSAVIFGKNRKNFSPGPETLTGYKACVYGKIKMYKGKPQMELVKADQLSVKPPKQ